MPASFILPQLCTRAAKPPQGEGWVHEIKFDGYRMFAINDSRAIQFRSRNNLEWTERFRKAAAEVARRDDKL